MNKDIENIIRANLPEKKDTRIRSIVGMSEAVCSGCGKQEECSCDSFNQALSQIDTKRIADEVLKVVEKARQEGIERGRQEAYIVADSCEKKGWDFKRFLLNYGVLLLSNLSPNKENEISLNDIKDLDFTETCDYVNSNLKPLPNKENK